MKNYIKILSLLIFIVILWSINSFVEPIINSDLYKLNELKKQLSLKESFNKQNSPANISKSISEFIPEKLDKTKLTDLIVKFSQESGISIKSVDIKELKTSITGIDDINLNSNKEKKVSSFDSKDINTNTLKTIELNIKFTGDKRSIDLFLNKLVKSKQYIDIQNISMNYSNKSLDNKSKQIEGNIIAKLYYTNL